MDAVSVETSPENEWIKQRLIDGKVSGRWEFDKNLNHQNYWNFPFWIASRINDALPIKSLCVTQLKFFIQIFFDATRNPKNIFSHVAPLKETLHKGIYGQE